MSMTFRRRIAAAAVGLYAASLPYAALAQTYKPLGPNVTLETFISRLINILLGLVGSLSLVVFVWSGFLWMTSAGNSDKAKVARKNMTYAAIGLVVIFGSYTILNFIF